MKKQEDLNTTVPLAHLSERYLKEYRSRIFTSAAGSAFDATIKLTIVAGMVAAGAVITALDPASPLIILPMFFGAWGGLGFFSELKKFGSDILKLEEVKSISKEKEVYLGSVIVTRDKRDDELKLAMSSLVEVLHNKSKLKSDDPKIAEFDKSIAYFMQVISESYSPDKWSKTREESRYIDLVPYDAKYFTNKRNEFVERQFSNFVSASFSWYAMGGFAYLGYISFMVAPISTLIGAGSIAFCAGMVVNFSYRSYEAFYDFYKAFADRKFDNTLSSNVRKVRYASSDNDLDIQSLLNKELDVTVKDLKVTDTEAKILRKQVVGEFTKILEVRDATKAEEAKARGTEVKTVVEKVNVVGANTAALAEQRATQPAAATGIAA